MRQKARANRWDTVLYAITYVLPGAGLTGADDSNGKNLCELGIVTTKAFAFPYEIVKKKEYPRADINVCFREVSDPCLDNESDLQ